MSKLMTRRVKKKKNIISSNKGNNRKKREIPVKSPTDTGKCISTAEISSVLFSGKRSNSFSFSCKAERKWRRTLFGRVAKRFKVDLPKTPFGKPFTSAKTPAAC
jgi:hypothetical protein